MLKIDYNFNPYRLMMVMKYSQTEFLMGLTFFGVRSEPFYCGLADQSLSKKG